MVCQFLWGSQIFLWGNRRQLQIAIINTMVQDRGRLTIPEVKAHNPLFPVAPTNNMALHPRRPPMARVRRLDLTRVPDNIPAIKTIICHPDNILTVRITIPSRDSILATILVCLINNRFSRPSHLFPVETTNSMDPCPPRNLLFPAVSSMGSLAHPPRHFTRRISRASQAHNTHRGHKVHRGRRSAAWAGRHSFLSYQWS